MALRLKKDIKKASYYVWFLGARESRGLRGEEYALPAIAYLEERARDLEPFKVTLQVSHKGLKIIQNVTAKGKQQTIKHFIPHGSVTSAVLQGDVVACVLLLYNPLTGCPVHVHVYRCDSEHTAELLHAHLQALVERPENQKKFADIERKLRQRGALPNKPPDSSLGSEVSTRESDSGSTEERCVANLYDSLAAELKQKLSTGKSPILLPPRDYDTVHRQKGNLSNIDTRRCLNQNIVGVNARRKLESSGGSSGIGSDLAPSPDRADRADRADYRHNDNHSTSEEEWAESTAYMMHEAYDASPPRRALSPPRPRDPYHERRPRSLSPERDHERDRRPRPLSPERDHERDRRPRPLSPERDHERDRRPRPLSPERDHERDRRPRPLSPERDHERDRRPRPLSPEHDHERGRRPRPLSPEHDHDRYDGPVRRMEREHGWRSAGRMQRGASEGSLQLVDASPRDRFHVAKEKFMNLERERFTRELETRMAQRRSLLEARARSPASPPEERRPERLPRVAAARHAPAPVRYDDELEFERYERERIERERYERERRRDDPEEHGGARRERRAGAAADRQRAFSRSRLLDEQRQQRQSYAEERLERPYYEREFRDLPERAPAKFRHSYAEPLARARLPALRPY